MSRIYECLECHVVQTKSEGLCRPEESWTPCLNRTVLEDNLRNLCGRAISEVNYFCSGCGRPAEEDKLLCLPTALRS
jgi:nitrate reductase cytochrome c-type subunit